MRDRYIALICLVAGGILVSLFLPIIRMSNTYYVPTQNCESHGVYCALHFDNGGGQNSFFASPTFVLFNWGAIAYNGTYFLSSIGEPYSFSSCTTVTGGASTCSVSSYSN
jgi:hypothetical protein